MVFSWRTWPRPKWARREERLVLNLTPGLQVLNDRYRLIEPLDLGISSQDGYRVWRAADAYENEYCVKAWPFQGDRPNDVDRALWDIELRHLFRLTSSPEAESRLVTLRDAGVDRAVKHLIMVLAAPGLTTLEHLLQQRSLHRWLRDFRDIEIRREVWKGIRRVALGLDQVHGLQMLHRAIAASSVFLHPDIGPQSMRLGGFEFTVRVVAPVEAITTRANPRDLAETLNPTQSYSFESDWLRFGMLAARILAPALQSLNAGVTSYEQTIQGIRSSELLDIERFLLERLLDSKPETRLARGDEVVEQIDEVLRRLDRPARRDEEAYLGLVVLLGPGKQLTGLIQLQDDQIKAHDRERQRAFVEEDLREARIVRIPPDTYVLVGSRLSYFIVDYRPDEESASGNWDLAFSPIPRELRSAGDAHQVEVKGLPIKVFTASEAKQFPTNVRRKSVPWKDYLPQRDEGEATRTKLEMLHEFLRITNQIDLLLYDAEVFAYERGEIERGETFDRVTIHEIPRERLPLSFARFQGDMVDFLDDQLNDKPADDSHVYLGQQESLDLPETPMTLFWKVEKLDRDDRRIVLTRGRVANQMDPPDRGFLRGYGMFGQVSLIRRRRRAIDNLRNHTYLLRTLLFPDHSFIDSEDKLPKKIDPDKIDESKRDALANIWRTRPVFALQGPPGTGKTTLVANLIGEIFAEDNVAQLLVTAQAHAAVEVLHQRVQREIFGASEEEEFPLVVRIPRGDSKQGSKGKHNEYEPRQVTIRMLKRAAEHLDVTTRTPLQDRWRDALTELIAGLQSEDPSGGAGDMEALVRRAANITFCTTTAGALANLAVSNQSFDWSVIEEAGKAHAFEVVMPLQSGHRWLLIGDHNQLPPYRYKNFRDALDSLDDVVAALERLPGRGSGLVDIEFARLWNSLEEQEKQDRRNFWLPWLGVFEQIFRRCEENISKEPRLSRVFG
jgi:AAA domain